MRSSQWSIDRSRSGCLRPLERAVIAEQPPDAHPLVEPALLGQVADAVVRGPRVALAQDLDLALVGKQDVHDHPQRRRLARPVRPDEAVERPARHGQVQVVDRDDAAESLGHPAEDDGVAHGFPGADTFKGPGLARRNHRRSPGDSPRPRDYWQPPVSVIIHEAFASAATPT